MAKGLKQGWAEATEACAKLSEGGRVAIAIGFGVLSDLQSLLGSTPQATYWYWWQFVLMSSASYGFMKLGSGLHSRRLRRATAISNRSD